MEKDSLLILSIVSVILISFIFLNKETVYVLISIDTERDLSPILSSFKGIEEGMPYFLDLLDEYNVKASFFVTGLVSEKYPELLRIISSRNHELCGHSYLHENFSELTLEEIRSSIFSNVNFIENITGVEVNCFRAPYQLANDNVSIALNELGISVEGSHLVDYPAFTNYSILRIATSPLIYPSTTFNNSWISFYERTIKNQAGIKVVVVGLHPWELVSMPRVSGYEEYTNPSGEYTRNSLEELLEYLKNKNVKFITFSEFEKLFSYNL